MILLNYITVHIWIIIKNLRRKILKIWAPVNEINIIKHQIKWKIGSHLALYNKLGADIKDSTVFGK